MNTRIQWLLSAFLLSITCTVTEAAIFVNYSGFVVDSSGAGIPNATAQVWVGTFTSGFNVSANAGDLNALFAHWEPFPAVGDSTSTANTTSFGAPGHFAQSASLAGDPTSFLGQKIYLWAFETGNAAAPNTTTWNNVSQYGLFYNPTDSLWTFPSSAPVTDDFHVIDSSQSGLTAVNSSWGSINTSYPLPSSGFSSGSLQLAPVPEPAECAFAIGVGLLAFAAYRRFGAKA